jgi:chorismate dehydratase
MTSVRLGAVGYLNARPLVFGLDRSPRFELRYDVPSRCAALLHEEAIDVGLIPSIEYLRGGPYRIVPDLAIASRGPVASVALYTTKPMRDVRSIAMDTSSRTSVALVRVLCARLYRIQPAMEALDADLSSMLKQCDAALIIGDNALFLNPDDPDVSGLTRPVHKEDLGETWTALTGLPFVYAFWAGRPGAVTSDDVAALQQARDEGVKRPDELARAYFPDRPERQAIGARYLRDNITYRLDDEDRAGLEAFYRYAAEAGVVDTSAVPRFFGAADGTA